MSLSLVLLVTLAHAEPSSAPRLAVGPVREWVQSVAVEGMTPPTNSSTSLGSAPVETTVPGLAAPRVGIAWPLAAGQDQAAAVLVELIAGPSGVLERRLVFSQEVAVRVESGSVRMHGSGEGQMHGSGEGQMHGSGGALVVLVQLRPGVHPGVAQAAIESTVGALLALEDVQLQAEIDRASAALLRDHRLKGAPVTETQTPVAVADLRSLTATLGMPSAWRVAVFRPEDQP